MKKTLFIALCLIVNYGHAMDKEQAFENRMAAMRKTQEQRARLAAKAKEQEEQAKTAAAKNANACKHDGTREAVVVIIMKNSAQ